MRDLSSSIGIPATLDALRPDDLTPIAELAVAEAFADYPVPRFLSVDDCEAVIAELLPADR